MSGKTWFWKDAENGRVCLFEGRDGFLDIRRERPGDLEEKLFSSGQPRSLLATMIAQGLPVRSQNVALFLAPAKGETRGDPVEPEIVRENSKGGSYGYAFTSEQLEEFGAKGAVIKAKGSNYGPVPLLCCFQTERQAPHSATFKRVDVEEGIVGNVKPSPKEKAPPRTRPGRVNVAGE